MEQFKVLAQEFFSNELVEVVITAALILIATAVIARIVKNFLTRYFAYGEQKGMPSSSLFVNVSRATIWVLGVCTMLDTCFGVDVSGIITALGVGGIALSLGLQNTISNFIGGLQVSLMRIVVPGDHIMVGTSKGVVEDVSWRHTTIRNVAGQCIYIPNSTINTTALVHLPPVSKALIPIVVTASSVDLVDVGAQIEELATQAAQRVGELEIPAKVKFTGVEGLGFTGSISFVMVDGSLVSQASDEVIRAVAHLTKGSK